MTGFWTAFQVDLALIQVLNEIFQEYHVEIQSLFLTFVTR